MLFRSIPATPTVWRECMRRGYTDIFMDAGCAVSTPTCGPCLGGYMGILAKGERCVSTTNRNFVGRMGHVESEVYLASPATAAASGVMGHIAHPADLPSLNPSGMEGLMGSYRLSDKGGATSDTPAGLMDSYRVK